ncbi:MAG: SGNH/GDSL hydrolase family protein [Bacteroidales bacterium]|nr:SGNH/GDSL hydrolase family protein [Bacteroidales bacterium]
MRKLHLILSFSIFYTTLFGIVPQKMSYQAIIRNTENLLITQKTVGMRISILQSTVDGTAVYVETQTPTTNTNGLINIQIGGGTIVSGSFASIDWSKGDYYIKTETDPTGGTDYSISATSQLLSVPYALHATTADTLSSFPLNKKGEIIGVSPRKLKNKFVASIGDSHMMAAWLPKFCELTGSSYSKELETTILNNQGLYFDSGLMMGQAKALKQYCTELSTNVDVILIENCHFGAEIGKSLKDYVPQVYDNLQTYGTTYGSYQAFAANYVADRAAFVATLTPNLNTAIRFNYSSKKETITFKSTGAIAAGTISLTINGAVFDINVTADMTLTQVVTALNDWAFNDFLTVWTNASTKGTTRTNGTIELNYIGADNSVSEPIITFDGGVTGITMTTYTLTANTYYQDFYFSSLNLSDWNINSKWTATNGTTAYSAMMGLLEYLQSNFPTTEIVVWGVQNLYVSKNHSATNSYQFETTAGSGQYKLNINAYNSNADVIKYQASKAAMKEVTEAYNCRFLDVDKACGISIFNMFSGGYYNENNVHPTTAGYERWGETLAKLY